MKIVIAIHHFPPHYTGGAELRAYRTASALQDRGHEVKVLYIEEVKFGSDEEVSWEDGQYQDVSVRKYALTVKVSPNRLPWLYSDPTLGKAVSEFLAEFRPDIFHLFSGYLMTINPLQAAVDLGIPVAVSLTDYWYLCPRLHLIRSNRQPCTLSVDPVDCVQCLAEERRRFRYPGMIFPALLNKYWRRRQHLIEEVTERSSMLRNLLNQANVLIAPSQFIISVYQKNGFDSSRMLHMRQGVEEISSEIDRIEESTPPTLRIGYIGQMIWVKGVHTLLAAAQQLKGMPIGLKMVGGFEPGSNYSRIVKRLSRNLNIEWLGKREHKELEQVFREIDVLLVPSLWYENSPNVVLEAFAHRTPVIASEIGGIPELVLHGQNGLLFKPGDVNELAHQIRRLLVEPDLLKKLQRGIQQVKRLDEEIIELEQVYLSICKNSPIERV